MFIFSSGKSRLARKQYVVDGERIVRLDRIHPLDAGPGRIERSLGGRDWRFRHVRERSPRAAKAVQPHADIADRGSSRAARSGAATMIAGIAVSRVSLSAKGHGSAGLDRLEIGKAVGRGETDAVIAFERRGCFSERGCGTSNGRLM